MGQRPGADARGKPIQRAGTCQSHQRNAPCRPGPQLFEMEGPCSLREHWLEELGCPLEASDGVNGWGMALVAAWRIPPASLATDPSPNPTSRPPRRNPQYAHQQPKSSQALSGAQRSRRISLASAASSSHHFLAGAVREPPVPLRVLADAGTHLLQTMATTLTLSCPRACGDPSYAPQCPHPPPTLTAQPYLPIIDNSPQTHPFGHPDPLRPLPI